MLIGNRESFAIEVRPLTPSWERRYRPERAAWGGLLVWVDGKNLCRHSVVGSDTFDDPLNVPLGPIANWLVRSWVGLLFEERASLFGSTDRLHETLERWGSVLVPADVQDDAWIDAREAWWSRHFLRAGADGAVLPNVAFARDDEKLVVEWKATRYPDSDLILLVVPEGSSHVAWTEAEQVFARFVQVVREWLVGDGLGDLYAWLEHGNPLRDMPTSAVSAVEFYTGRSEGDLRSIFSGSNANANLSELLGLSVPDDPAASPLTQVLRDLPRKLPERTEGILRDLNEATSDGGTDALMSLRALAFDAARGSDAPEEAAQFAARALRRELGFDGQPIEDESRVLRQVGVSVGSSDLLGVGRMVTGMRVDGGAKTMVLNSPRTAVPWGRRFEVARSLGHLLLDPLRGGALGAGSSSVSSGIRRRRSGAFAAEFLLPMEGLLDVSGGKLDQCAEPAVFKRLLDRFGVGAGTAAYQLWNHGLLSNAEVRDELIEEFAAGPSA